MSKVKVIEVEAVKLDPNAKYLIVFNITQMPRRIMEGVAKQLRELGIEAAYTEAPDPETALKVYQIPAAPQEEQE